MRENRLVFVLRIKENLKQVISETGKSGTAIKNCDLKSNLDPESLEGFIS